MEDGHYGVDGEVVWMSAKRMKPAADLEIVSIQNPLEGARSAVGFTPRCRTVHPYFVKVRCSWVGKIVLDIFRLVL